jgi:hypothetical protein
MATAASLLELIEAVIEKRLNGDAYESWSDAELEFRGTKLDDLFERRTRLQNEARAESGSGIFRQAERID